MMSAIPVMSLSGEVYYPVFKMGTLKLREVKALPKTSRFRPLSPVLQIFRKPQGWLGGGPPWPPWPCSVWEMFSEAALPVSPPPCPHW